MKIRYLLFVFTLVLLIRLPLARAEDDGFVSIFDGKTLEGWDGKPGFWSVRDGAITGQTTAKNPTAGNTFIIWRGGKVGDFELNLEYRIVGNNEAGQANSGIQYRSFETPDNKWGVGGYQGDFEAGGRFSGILYGENFRGILAHRGQETVIKEGGKVEVIGSIGDSDEIQAKIKKEDWNDYHIIAKGFHFVHKINGVVTAKATDEDSARRATGIVALQLHQGPPMTVQFRNIRLKRTGNEAAAATKQRKRVVFVAGTRSHGYAAHEHYAGCHVLAKSLERSLEGYEVELVRGGWPKDESVFEGADAIVMYADGGPRHPVNPHLAAMDKLADAGVGIVCIHYAVEVPAGETGDHFLKWIGGYFEENWSVNPHWTAEFDKLPQHPITRGVKPFKINDEWYYHMRFRDGMKGVTPILTDLPGPETLKRRDGPHAGNPHVRAAVLERKEPQHVAWASAQPNGQRGFGFTGGHFHWNWGDRNFRKLVLNAIVWAAHGEVPAEGVIDQPVTIGRLEKNQDYPQPENFDRSKVEETLKASNSSHEPADAIGQLRVHPELDATLFAAEPMMLSPSNIDIDHLGRVWVCEVVNYRLFNNTHFPERRDGDRILVLEDTDSDGKADKACTFYQGRDIDSAHGICVLATPSGHGTRALVSAGDSVFYLIDEDNDLKADRKELLFTGIEGAEHDHGIHAFVFGSDGKLYFNFGNMGKKIRNAQGQPIVDLAGNKVQDDRQPYQQGMVFRCNLDGSEFETLGWNFRNAWEVSVDSFGTLWQSDNDDDGNRGTRINFVMEFGNYGYCDEMTGATWKEERTGMHEEIPSRHWHLNDPGVVPNLLQTGAGSPTGILVYEGRLLPNVFRGQVIHCDAGPNVVRAYPIQNAGAGYTAELVNILDGAANQWFRPSDVCTAPDGSLLVADWYDSGVGGHRMEDAHRGRLFRVTPKGHPGRYEVPDLDFSTAPAAARALDSPNLATRYMAWTALHELGKHAEPTLAAVYQSRQPRRRARALWLLGKIEGRGQHYVDVSIADKDPNIRIQGLRLARQLKFDVIPFVQRLIDDSSPQVRRELAIALRHNKSPAAAGLWTKLALQHDGRDRWYLEALGIGADNQWDAFLATWLDKVGENWSTTAGRDILWRSRGRQTPGYLAKILADESTPAETHARYFRAFDFLSGPEKDQALKTLLGL